VRQTMFRALMPKNWMLYGANGYTSLLTIPKAVEAGLRPILAGRNRSAIEPLARQYDLPYRVFSLDDADQVARELEDCELVLHSAGPFIDTASVMMQACLRSRTHYLDITGEMAVFEMAAGLGGVASEAGLMLLPGAGFDIVPGDCLALQLKQLLPDATRLHLAVQNFIGFSKGTVKSLVRILEHTGQKVRRNGVLVDVPPFGNRRQVQFFDKPVTVYSLALADPFTAYHTTGIPEIEIFSDFLSQPFVDLRVLGPALRMSKVNAVANALVRGVEALYPNPSQAMLDRTRMFIWGEVQNASGKTVERLITTENAYVFTADASVACVKRTLEGTVKPGYQTPARVFGADFLFDIPGGRLIR
jgi:short subunit dehydrogenase-like uncharacterized protein